MVHMQYAQEKSPEETRLLVASYHSALKDGLAWDRRGAVHPRLAVLAWSTALFD